MPINVKISLCKITRASKLFQRNYYLPLLKPLSPKDALRRKIITGQNVLGNRIEHYIPVLKPQEEKIADHRRHGKGPVIKKKVKRHENMKYMEPFFDENMQGHNALRATISRKPRGKGQNYVYEVPDKNCVLVVNAQFERALKDKDIVDITMAQRSEKIVVKLKNGSKVQLPLAPFENGAPLYRGSGWTKEAFEQEHHHGKETMSIAKLFEAKESGVEEWELEMMRLANKRKKKGKGEDHQDWKKMMTDNLESMDWDQFDEDTKQIVDELEEIVEEENIPMAVDDMEKTRHVNEKLKAAGPEVINKLPLMKEISDVIKNMENGDMTELANVSGAMVGLPSGKKCFVTGQMVKGDEDASVFVPGQTVEKEDGSTEYTPGITINMDGEPSLIPGLVMGEEEKPPMFLPGESKITEGGQLQFQATDEDLGVRRRRELSPTPPPPPPKPRPPPQEVVIQRRVIEEPVIKELRVKKRPPLEIKELSPPRRRQFSVFEPMEDPLRLIEEQRRAREEEERKRMKERMEEKMLKEETKVNQLRMQIRKKCREMKIEKPVYVPIEPVKKSQKLEELEQSIRKGTFFEDDKTKEILERARNSTRMLKYQSALNPLGNDWRL